MDTLSYISLDHSDRDRSRSPDSSDYSRSPKRRDYSRSPKRRDYSRSPKRRDYSKSSKHHKSHKHEIKKQMHKHFIQMYHEIQQMHKEIQTKQIETFNICENILKNVRQEHSEISKINAKIPYKTQALQSIVDKINASMIEMQNNVKQSELLLATIKNPSTFMPPPPSFLMPLSIP